MPTFDANGFAVPPACPPPPPPGGGDGFDLGGIDFPAQGVTAGLPAEPGAATAGWVVPVAGRPDLSQADAVRLAVGDVRFLAFDFGDLPELAAAGAVISAAAVTADPATGLTLGPPAVLAGSPGGYRVGLWVKADAAGEYTLACAAALPGGAAATGRGGLIAG